MRTLMLMIIVALCACGESAERVQLTEETPSTPTVTTQRAASTRIRRLVRATGTTAPVRASELGAVVSGVVRSVHVREGQHVERGQLLVRLDAASARLAAAQASASAAAARAQAELARAEMERLVPLASDGTITAQQAEQLRAQQSALSAAADAADIAAQQARRNVADTTVRAPFAGTVSRLYVEAGEMASRTPPTTLLRLVDLSTIEVRARVHESKLPAIREGSGASVRVGGRDASGVVEYFNPELDTTTRSAEVVIHVPNENGELRAGMSAEVDIEPSGETEALLVPWAAIVVAGDERFAFVFADDAVERRAVVVEAHDDELANVVDGLRDGETVVVDGLEGLADGVEVEAIAAHSDESTQ